MNRLFAAIAFVVLATLCCADPAFAERRVALSETDRRQLIAMLRRALGA